MHRIIAPAGGQREDLALVQRDAAPLYVRQVRVEVRAAGVNPADWKSV